MSDLPQAAASGVTQEVAGETWEIQPLDLKDLGALERQALKAYKDHSIESWVEMAAKYLPEAERFAAIRKKIDEVAFLDVDVLPEKDGMTAEVQPDGTVKQVPQRLPYAAWWMTKTFEGMLHFVWYSAKKGRPGLTLDECAKKVTLGGGQKVLSQLVGTVEEVSRPTLVGN